MHDATEPGVLEGKVRERLLTSGKITSAVVERRLPVVALGGVLDVAPAGGCAGGQLHDGGQRLAV